MISPLELSKKHRTKHLVAQTIFLNNQDISQKCFRQKYLRRETTEVQVVTVFCLRSRLQPKFNKSLGVLFLFLTSLGRSSLQNRTKITQSSACRWRLARVVQPSMSTGRFRSVPPGTPPLILVLRTQSGQSTLGVHYTTCSHAPRERDVDFVLLRRKTHVPSRVILNPRGHHLLHFVHYLYTLVIKTEFLCQYGYLEEETKTQTRGKGRLRPTPPP